MLGRRAILLMLAALLPLHAQSEDGSAPKTLQSIPVVVAEDVLPVEGLTARDFHLADEGQPVSIADVTRQRMPVDVVVIVPQDLRDWARGRELANSMQRAVQDAVTRLLLFMEPGDRVGMVVQHLDADIQMYLTADRDAIAAGIAEIGTHRDKNAVSTTLGDTIAIEYALHMLTRANEVLPARRCVIVKVGGAVSTFGPAYFSPPLAKRLWQAGVTFATLDVLPASSILARLDDASSVVRRLSSSPANAPGFASVPMRNLAVATGGEHLFSFAPEQVHSFFSRQREPYLLWFDTPPGATLGEVRELKVELVGDLAERYPGAVLRAPTGYVVR